MLPKVAIIRIADAEKMPLPQYIDGVGTSMILRSANTQAIKIAPQHFEVIETGIAVALPLGMEAQVRSLKESTETGILVINAPLTIDASDRKEIKVCLYNISQESVIVKQGDPIGLLVFTPALRIEWMDVTQKITAHIQENQTYAQQNASSTVDTPVDIKSEETPVETNKEENISDELSKNNLESSQASISIDKQEASISKIEEFEPLNIEETAPEIISEPVLEAQNIPENELQNSEMLEPTPSNLEQMNEVSPETQVVLENESQILEIREPQALNFEQTNEIPAASDVNISDTLQEQSITLEENTSTEPLPVIEPPAILAEFEKMENDFYNKIPDLPDIPSSPKQQEEKKDNSDV